MSYSNYSKYNQILSKNRINQLENKPYHVELKMNRILDMNSILLKSPFDIRYGTNLLSDEKVN